MNTSKRLVNIIKLDHPKFPLSDKALAEIKCDLENEYSKQIATSTINTLTNAIFYKNSILNSEFKYSKKGVPSQLIKPHEKEMVAIEMAFVKNEAYKIVKNFRRLKIKTPLSCPALNELQKKLINQDGIKPRIAKKAIYSFVNSISYQKTIIKASNTHFFDLEGNPTSEVITVEHVGQAKSKYSHFNRVYNCSYDG